MTDLVESLPASLRRPVRSLVVAKGIFISIASLIMALTFMFVVVLRYGFQADLFAYEEWLLVICFWLYFMAGALGTYTNSHINADLLSYVTESRRLRWIRAVVVCSIELVVSAVVVYWAVLMVRDEIGYYPYWQTTIALNIPFLVPRLGILVGFVLMTMYSALHLYVLLKEGAGEAQADRRSPEPMHTFTGE